MLVGELSKTDFIYFQTTEHRNPTHIHMLSLSDPGVLGHVNEFPRGGTLLSDKV